ncbi:hypothetical protein ACFL7M_08680 [Thermodesulfobacteriota bacterium]
MDTVIDTKDPNYPVLDEELIWEGYYKGELTHKRKDGTKFPCEISSLMFKDKEGNDRASVIVRDSLTIEDDGKGMDEKTMDRIFEPFFQLSLPAEAWKWQRCTVLS